MGPVSFYQYINPAVDEVVKKYYELEPELEKHPSYSQDIREAASTAFVNMCPHLRRVSRICHIYMSLADSCDGKLKALEISRMVNEIYQGIIKFKVFVFDSPKMRQRMSLLLDMVKCEDNPTRDMLCHSV
jgi:hypothetical protein